MKGLIVLTNDGDLANKLSHPSYEVSKTYFVEVDGYLTVEAIKALESVFGFLSARHGQ